MRSELERELVVLSHPVRKNTKLIQDAIARARAIANVIVLDFII
jgi:hypothetical protein